MKNKKGLTFLVTSLTILCMASTYGYGSKSRKKLSILQPAYYSDDLRDEIRTAKDKCANAPWSRKKEACDKADVLEDELYDRRD